LTVSSISNFFFLSSVQMCWLGINQLNILVELDVRGSHRRLPCSPESSRTCFIAGMGLELDLLQVQDDVGDIFDDAVHGGELVHGAVNLDGGDGGAFERAEQHAAERVADGVAVTGFKRFSDELGVGFAWQKILSFCDRFGHFKTT
jgi:hypothetical protein